MWKSVTLRDFQKHKKVTVELSPTVTTLLGGTAAGKSTVLRAVRWVAFNRPAGSGIVRRGAKGAAVAVVTSSGRAVRRKGKGVNEYLLNGDKSVAFGSAVPVQVSAFLNLQPVNFQRQFDPPFWLTDSPGDLSKKLNALTGLDRADQTSTALAARRRDLTAEIKVLTDQRDRAKRFLFDCKPFAVVLEARAAEREAAQSHARIVIKRDLLADLIADVENADQAMETARIASRAAGEYLADLKAKVAAKRSATVLADLIDAAAFAVPPDALSELEKASAEFEAARESADRSADSAANLDAHVRTIEEAEASCRGLEKELETAAAKAGACPACGQSLCR